MARIAYYLFSSSTQDLLRALGRTSSSANRTGRCRWDNVIKAMVSSRSEMPRQPWAHFQCMAIIRNVALDQVRTNLRPADRLPHDDGCGKASRVIASRWLHSSKFAARCTLPSDAHVDFSLAPRREPPWEEQHHLGARRIAGEESFAFDSISWVRRDSDRVWRNTDQLRYARPRCGRSRPT